MPSTPSDNGRNIPPGSLPANSRREGLVLVPRCKPSFKGRKALLERHPLSLVFGQFRAQLFDLLGLMLILPRLLLQLVEWHRIEISIK